VLRWDGIEAALDAPPEPVVVTDAFPEDGHHGWKYIAFGPDGLLYVPVGAPCNICEPSDKHAAIFRMKPDGSAVERYAGGVRNTVGSDWDASGTLWFTDNGRDWLGDDTPPCELNRAPQAGLDRLPDAQRSFRAFAPRELAKLDAECRGFLLTLEHSRILDPRTRELVIERSVAASGETLSLEQLKLIVLMVLWNQQTPTSRLVAEELFSAPHARLPS